MIRWLKSLFAWRLAHEAGVYAYYENAVTGHRRAARVISGGHSPVAQRWLDGGEWGDRAAPPNTGGSCVKPPPPAPQIIVCGAKIWGVKPLEKAETK